MAVNAKHLATFIIGAAAGVAIQKYLQTEEGEKALEDLKVKASDLKVEAEKAMERAPEYFEKLKQEATAIIGDKFPEAEKFIDEILNMAKKAKTQQA